MGQPGSGTMTINDANPVANDFNPATRAVEAMVTAQVIGVAARLGVADHLASGPRPGADLVRDIGAHPEDGPRFLNACVAAGLLAEEKPGAYALTPAGALLRSDGESVRNLAITLTGPAHWLPVGRLMETVISGEPAVENALGMGIWDYYKSHPEEEAFLAAGMSENTTRAIVDVVRHYDFSGLTRIVDVGGSRGDLLCAMLAAAPGASGVLFDRPEAVIHAADTIASHDLAGRVDVVGGSFLDEVPPGGDLYVLKSVLCDWDDSHVMKILENCRRASTKGARLLVADGMLPPGERQPFHWLALICPTVMGGRMRTVAEMTGLMTAAGYRGGRLVATTDMITLVEAEAA